ncbi:uncharacterized protein LOC125810277 [Solanum verrucosum]|uniref:uncharacterized protein LOC125810277 n=1 Tax=Solanum verrucosum TaxID=315347 RepID=UPI0020D1844B|nr:uncharacterized protein LOC125810277 [Solanum verrucosum]
MALYGSHYSRGKQTIDPPMPSGVEVEASKNDDVIKVNGEFEIATEKKVEITQKVVPILRTPPPFPQRLVKKTEEVKYRSFIKEGGSCCFPIPCTIGLLHFAKALCDLGASINLMSLAIYKKLGLEDPKSTVMRLLMTDRTVKKPIGVLQDVLMKVESFIFPADFLILDCDVDFEVPIILETPFLATRRALVDMEKGKMKFRLKNEEATFNISRSMK